MRDLFELLSELQDDVLIDMMEEVTTAKFIPVDSLVRTLIKESELSTSDFNIAILGFSIKLGYVISKRLKSHLISFYGSQLP